MIEGGIAGTVNLAHCALPFDSEGFVGAFSGEVGYGNLAEEAKPAGSMLLSNRWETGIGEFGVMVNAAYSEVVTESQGVQLLRFFDVQDVAGLRRRHQVDPGWHRHPRQHLRSHAQGRFVGRAVAAAPEESVLAARCSTTAPSTRTTGKSIR